MKKEFGRLPDESRRYFTIRTIIDMQIRDVVGNSERLIEEAGVQSVNDVRLCASPLIQHSPERRKLNRELRRYLYKNLYYNPGRTPAQPACGENAGTTFQILSGEPGEARRNLAETHQENRPAPGGVRLPRRHDGPLCHARKRAHFRQET